MVIHSGSLTDAIKIICLLELNMYGVISKIFIKIMKKSNIFTVSSMKVHAINCKYITFLHYLYKQSVHC